MQAQGGKVETGRIPPRDPLKYNPKSDLRDTRLIMKNMFVSLRQLSGTEVSLMPKVLPEVAIEVRLPVSKPRQK